MKKKKGYLGLLIGFVAVCTFCLNAEASNPVDLHHVHDDDACGKTTTQKMQNDSSIHNSTTNGTCPLCGGLVHYYKFWSSCSCGHVTSEATGYACIHSIRGNQPFDEPCTYYSDVSFNSSHMHPVIDYACGLTENTVVGTLELSQSTTDPAQEITLTATVSNLSDTIDATSISYNWSTGETTPNILVTSNNSYSCSITYSENSVVTTSDDADISVTNIDRVAPTIMSLAADITEKTTGKVTLTVDATDDVGLAAEPYSWDGKIYSAVNNKKVSKNGTYTVYVKDIAGNVAQSSIKIKNIYTPPQPQIPSLKIVDLYPNTTEPAHQVVLTVVTEPSTASISWDGGNTWNMPNTSIATGNTEHTVMAKDEYGHIARKSIKISNIIVDDKEEPKPKTSEKPDNPPIEPDTAPSEIEPESVESVEEAIPSDVPKSSTEEDKVEKETIVVEAKKTEPSKKEIVTTILVSSGVATGGGGAVLFVFFFLFGGKTAKIYSMFGMNYQRIGISKIRKQGGWSISISNKKLSKAQSNRFMCKLPKHFVKKHLNEAITISIDGNSNVYQIQHEIRLEV